MTATDTHTPADAQASQPFIFPGTEAVDAAEVFSGPGYNAPQPRTHPEATVAMWLSALSLLIAIMLPASLILSVVALCKTYSDKTSKTGRHEALAGFVLSAIGLTTWGILILMVFFFRP